MKACQKIIIGILMGFILIIVLLSTVGVNDKQWGDQWEDVTPTNMVFVNTGAKNVVPDPSMEKAKKVVGYATSKKKNAVNACISACSNALSTCAEHAKDEYHECEIDAAEDSIECFAGCGVSPGCALGCKGETEDALDACTYQETEAMSYCTADFTLCTANCV